MELPWFHRRRRSQLSERRIPVAPGEKPGWLVRIPGVAEELFQTIVETLRAAIVSEKYCYYHDWSEGLLLLLDNRRTLHGREAFHGQRSLVNIQVIADP